GGADAKSYILISQLPPDLYEKYVVDENTAYMSGFTFVIISIVHLAGGKIPEGVIEICDAVILTRYGWILQKVCGAN
ncbi:melanoma-associated antigen 10-like protein, partial [Trifolium pratense]